MKEKDLQYKTQCMIWDWAVPAIFDSDTYLSHLNPSEHAGSRHTEVQISNHLCCGRLINLWRPAARQVIYKPEQYMFDRTVIYWATMTLQKLIISRCVAYCQVVFSHAGTRIRYHSLVVQRQKNSMLQKEKKSRNKVQLHETKLTKTAPTTCLPTFVYQRSSKNWTIAGKCPTSCFS